MFSLFMLIFKREFVVTRINLNKPVIDYGFLKDNLKEIYEIIVSLASEQSLRAVIKQACLNIPQQNQLPLGVTVSAVLTMRHGQSILSCGTIGLSEVLTKYNLKTIGSAIAAESLEYNLRGVLTKEGFIFDGLELNCPQFSLKLWGILEENVLTLSSSLILTELPDLNIHDSSCVIKLEYPNIYIENLNFYLKNMPFSLKGSISVLESFILDLKLSSFFNQPFKERLNNPEAFDISLAGRLEQQNFNGSVNLYFLRATRTRAFWEKIETLFKNLSIYATAEGKINMSFEKADLSYTSGNKLYEIHLSDFMAVFYLTDRLIQFDKFTSGIFDGSLQGKGTLDIGAIPFEGYFDLSISGVNANNLHNLLMYCSKFEGDFSSQIHFESHPHLMLTGQLLISDGVLDNLVFFNWVADFLQIPSLNRINFDTLSTEFNINDEGISLREISLNSEGVNFEGFFTLYENDLVSSKLSLLLAKSKLLESAKLKRLIKYLDKDTSCLSFNFQLSGLMQTMNFKWLESDFKQVLEKILPAWLEQRIEKETEDIIKAISQK